MSTATAERTAVEEFVAGLRELADLYEAKPWLALPTRCNIDVYSLNEREELAAAARDLAPVRKVFADTLFHLERDFGPITLRVIAFRDRVCKKIVETVDVPERVAPAMPKRVIPATTREVVSWVCDDPLLAADGPSDA